MKSNKPAAILNVMSNLRLDFLLDHRKAVYFSIWLIIMSVGARSLSAQDIELTITGDQEVCANGVNEFIYTANPYSLQENLIWTVVGGTVVLPHPALNQVRIRWNASTSGTVSAYRSFTVEEQVPVYCPNELNQWVICWYETQNVTYAYYTPSPYPVTSRIPAVYTMGPGGTYCAGSAAVTLGGSQTGYNYQLLLEGNPNGLESKPGTGSPLTWSNLVDGGAYTVRATYGSTTAPPGGCPTIMAGSTPITILPRPTVTLIDPPSAACMNSEVTFTTQALQSDYDWDVSQSYQHVAGGSTSDNYITVRWTNQGAKTVSVNYTNSSGCRALVPLDHNVSVNGLSGSMTGVQSVCVGTTNVPYSTETGKTGYVWALPEGGGSISSGQGTSAIQVTWSDAGARSVSVTYNEIAGCTVLRSVTVHHYPSAITSVSGLRVAFAGDNANYFVNGSDALSFDWTPLPSGATKSDNGGYEQGRYVNVSYSTAGLKAFAVVPRRAECVGIATNFNVDILPVSAKKDSINFGHTEMTGLQTAYLYLSSRLATGQCPQTFGPVEASVKFDLGYNYNWGKNEFTKQVDFVVTAHYDYPGVQQSWTTSLVINKDKPEKAWIKKITPTPQHLRFIQVTVNAYSGSTSVNNYIRLKGKFKEANTVDVLGFTATPVTLTPVAGKWEQTFTWTAPTNCGNVPQYQFQMLRTYGVAPNWDHALSMETPGNQTNLKVTIAEGTGQYKWRVRALGNKTGGITNPQNWGTWSAESDFNFTQPEDNKNWIYKRTITDANKVSEMVTYATGLQHVNQQQSRLQSDNQVVAIQILQDYVGRNAITTLPVPVLGKADFGYQTNLLQVDADGSLYTPERYDDAPKSPTTAKVFGNYYGGTNVMDGSVVFNPAVADAEGFPYVRSIFAPNGLGRVVEQSRPGVKNSVISSGGKTTRTFYTAPMEGEILRLFGMETPQLRNVRKVVTIDPNDVVSVSYINKAGQVIATGLLPGGSTNQTALAAGSATFTDRVSGGTRIGSNVFSATKLLSFTQTTTVTVDYDITPMLVRALAYDPTGTLMGEYQFDGNANDGTGRGNHAAVVGATQNSGQFNTNAYNFDGTDDYLMIGDHPDVDFGSEDFTVSVWIRKAANSSSWDNGYGGVGKWNNSASAGTNEWNLALSSNGTNNIPSFRIESGTMTHTVNATSSLTLNTWHHVVAMRKSNELRIYFNGALQGTTPLPSSTTTVNNFDLPIYIGRIAAPGYFTSGRFDELKIYRRAISQSEVTDLFSCGVTTCKTCDYKVEFFLHREDDPNYTYPGLPTHTIVPGDCSQQSSLVWNPAPFTLSGLLPNINYVFEKRITVQNTNPVTGVEYLEEQVAALKTAKAASMNASLATINGYLNANDLSGLYAHLTAQGYAFDVDRNQYLVPLSCGDPIYVPRETICADFVPDGNCEVGGKTWEEYFEAENQAYLEAEDLDVAPGPTSELPYISFRNQYTSAVVLYHRGELDAMISNMRTDNPLLTCQDVWDIWIDQTRTFESMRESVFPGGYTFDFLEEFFKAVEAKLDSKRPAPGTSMEEGEFCTTAGPHYFLKKTQVYGKIGDVEYDHELVRAYRLVYFNQNIPNHLIGIRKKYAVPAMADDDPVVLATFTGPGSPSIPNECGRYQFYRLSKMPEFSDFPENPAIATEQAREDAMISCETMCESRRGEFFDAIIGNIVTQNPSATIERHDVYLNTFTSRWTAVYNDTLNTTGFTYSQCEVETMVDALVWNCQQNYCKLTPQYDANGLLNGYGSAAEIANYGKVLNNKFQVTVGPNGQSCSTGDYLSSQIISTLPPAENIAQNWHYGAIWSSPSNPLNFTHSFLVTRSADDSNPGSLRWAINQVNLHSAGSKLIYFEMPTPQRIELTSNLPDITVANVTIDGTTQPGFEPGNGPIIRMRLASSPNYILYVPNASSLSLIGLGFHVDGAFGGIVVLLHSSNVLIKSCVFSGGHPTASISSIRLNGSSSNTTIIGNKFLGVPGGYFAGVSTQNGPSTNIKVGGNLVNEGNLFENVASGVTYIHTSNSLIKNNVFLNVRELAGNPVTLYSNDMNVTGVRVSQNLSTGGRFPIRWILLSGNTINNNRAAPVISSVVKVGSTYTVSGTSIPNDEIELFLSTLTISPGDDQQELLRLLGVTLANGSGNWQLSNLDLPPPLYVSASGTDASGNTSLFSEAFQIPVPTSCVTNSLCFEFTSETLVPPAGLPIPPDAPVYQPVQIPCAETKGAVIRSSIEDQLIAILAALEKNFRDAYMARCPDPAGVLDNLTVSYQMGMLYHTLYYYDRAGNLMRTVSPKGVTYLTNLSTARDAETAHTLDVKYEYNSLGQTVKQTSADAGTTLFWYNDVGQLRFSQSSQQAIDLKYSYTKYDNLGRTIEVGEASGFVASNLEANKNNLTYPASGTHVTQTVYTTPIPPTELVLQGGLTQNFLRNRISYTVVDEDGTNTTTTDRTQTVYSYDAHGNVEWLIQNVATMDRPIKVEYEYDLISGNVLQVNYNAGQLDQFFHKYTYDADNRITRVSTSADGLLWEHEGRYKYYRHGPLRRVVIGEDEVQGIDYTYTIHGWIKGINNPLNLQNLTDTVTYDPGRDGNKLAAKDAFGSRLTYYSGDYKRTGHSLTSGSAGELLPATDRDLYNGNISAWTTNARYPSNSIPVAFRVMMGQMYTYDQLNRLLTTSTRTWNGSAYATTTNFANTYAYDTNGNLTAADNNGEGTTLNMDNLVYNYPLTSNKLSHVTESDPANAYPHDIEQGQAPNNYQYDAVGNLKRDEQQQTSIAWNPYGKVKQVSRDNGTVTTFKYDAYGNRVMKKMVNPAGLESSDYYVRDGSGNVLAIYNKLKQVGGSPELTLIERPLYGSERLGEYKKGVNLTGSGASSTPLQQGEQRVLTNSTKNLYEGGSYLVNSGVMLTLGPGFSYNSDLSNSFSVRVSPNAASTEGADVYVRELTTRDYELKDHLGNVRVVVQDRKNSTLTSGVPGIYAPEVLSVFNGTPFGLEHPNRNWGKTYRYGFNGKEKDASGEWGNASYDYGFRIYNPGLGRFLSVDPLTKEYPELTPYQFASNRPIDGIDLDGLEYYEIHLKVEDGTGVVHLQTVSWTKIEEYKFDYEKYSKSFGPDGQGIKYVYYHVTKGKLTHIEEVMTQEQGFWNFRNNLTRHGIYYGEGTSTYAGPLFKSSYNFGLPPIDTPDAMAREHDIEEEGPEYTTWMDTKYLAADVRFVKRLSKYLSKAVKPTLIDPLAPNPDFIDPYTGRKASEEAIRAASQAVVVFSAIILDKLGTLKEERKSGKITKDEYHRIRKEFRKALKEKMPK